VVDILEWPSWACASRSAPRELEQGRVRASESSQFSQGIPNLIPHLATDDADGTCHDDNDRH